MSEQLPPAARLTVRSAMFLGVGSMIGAGIFALLGEAGTVAGAAVWVSFLIGGVVALLLGYVCAKLGSRYPSAGGLITYLEEGFGRGWVVGVSAWLGYIAAIVIVTAMIAVSFGGYATSLFVGSDASPWWNHFFITLVVVGTYLLNKIGTRVVAITQSAIVIGVLSSFGIFIWVTISNIDLHLLAVDSYPSLAKIIASVALTFFAYLGFNVITFAAGDLKNPKRELPRALYGALGITTAVYVLIAIGVFGTLTVTEVVAYGETAIAEAVRPTLGDTGYTVMAVVALLSTTGATNATMYASSNLTGMLAAEGYFPVRFAKSGLLLTAAAVLAVANLVDLSSIASVGSAVSLVLFLMIGVAGYRRRADTGSNAVVVVLAILVTAVVLGFFAVDTWRTAPETFVAILAIVLAAVVLDRLTRRGGSAAGRASLGPA
jgi:amino acid transporter